MMQHIRAKTCINITTLAKAKKNGHNTRCNTTSDINIYWKYLDNLTKNIEARDIVTSDNEKFSVSIPQMLESD